MDIRQLHYFLVLCEEMNYTRAAQRLFLSRQALRQSISALEAELCGPLFLSAHHKLTLTDRGMSLQRHATPVVEQFQQMQAALRAEIQSAQPVHIGISVALVPDYLPGLETQLDKFRQQYPHVEMRFRLLDNDAVADAVEQGELDAGLVIDLGCAAPVLARTTLRADPACLLVPRGHPFWDRESIPLADLRGQRVLLPSLRQDLFSPLWDACAREGFAPNAEIGPSFYQAYYLVQEQLCTCLTRYEPGARRELDRVRDVLLEDLPPLCVSMVQRRDHNSAYLDLLRGYLMEVIGGAASLPPRRGRPAKPFYNFPVLSSAAPKAAPQHPAPGTQLPFAGGNNFRELGGYEADEGKHVKWGQIYRGIPTGLLTGAADRKLLDSLGLRLILDLRSESEAAEQPDYVPDGARLVRICGLCHPDGSEISFSPGDIEKLLKSKKDEEHNLADAMYEQMLFRNKAYKELFRALEAGETPILFHCSGGKDRTGVAAMLILLALGASDETICQDFVRTNVCRRPELEKIWAAHAEEIEAHPEQKQFYQGIAGVHPESAPFVLDTIRKKYGTTDAYLEAEYGLTPYAKISDPDRFMMMNYYKSGDRDIYFVVNSSIERSMQTRLEFPAEVAAKQAWVWDAETGVRHMLDVQDGTLELCLTPAEAKFIVFEKDRGGQMLPAPAPRSANPIALNGIWDVRATHHVDKSTREFSLTDLVDLHSLPFPWLQSFAGTIEYTRTVDVEDPAAYHTLDAGLTHNGITELFVNGEPAGVRWYGARTFDVAGKLRKGTNVLTIRVTTVLTNYAKARAADTPTAARWEWAQRLNKELGLRGPVTLY